ncbi:MAG TPA: hypothetical protein DEA08_02140 [Planctomycetes bacterium]|nr:hypothetical protein [Planctomycetota bacterium]|tara:strand:- start:903 stop:1586 length:684 start_codon:yes stop_codon:yes gene_type:complete
MNATAIAPALLAGALATLLATPAQAQQPPIPSKQEIMKRLDEGFPQLIEQSPEATVEVEGLFKLTYKQVPTDPKKIAEMMGKQLGTDKVPPGMIDQYMGMFAAEITQVLNKHLADIGEFEALTDLKNSSKKIPPGKHRFGILFEGEKPAALVVFDPKPKKGEEEQKDRLKKPVLLRLKTKSTKLQNELKIEGKESKKKPKKDQPKPADLVVTCLRYLAKTKKPIEAK